MTITFMKDDSFSTRPQVCSGADQLDLCGLKLIGKWFPIPMLCCTGDLGSHRMTIILRVRLDALGIVLLVPHSDQVSPTPIDDQRGRSLEHTFAA